MELEKAINETEKSYDIVKTPSIADRINHTKIIERTRDRGPAFERNGQEVTSSFDTLHIIHTFITIIIHKS